MPSELGRRPASTSSRASGCWATRQAPRWRGWRPVDDGGVNELWRRERQATAEQWCYGVDGGSSTQRGTVNSNGGASRCGPTRGRSKVAAVTWKLGDARPVRSGGLRGENFAEAGAIAGVAWSSGSRGRRVNGVGASGGGAASSLGAEGAAAQSWWSCGSSDAALVVDSSWL
jgi:hypothetical protein